MKMDYIEISAKTVDDAITEAIIKLGTTHDKIEYEVIEKGSAGFLGINRKDAVIISVISLRAYLRQWDLPSRSRSRRKRTAMS